MASSSALKFTVRRKPAVLLTPAAPTPRELKPLSDVDDQDGLRFLIANIFFFERRHSGRDVDDPVPVLRDAIARALVHYYPLAGRLRELEGKKLAVDCTGEGVLFVEADADDVRLEQFGARPPFPGVDELLFDLPGSCEILHAPLLHFQVTRLACGGFVLAFKIHHTMVDGQGVVQFMEAVAELARGAAVPTVRPVWGRELLMAPCNDTAPLRFAHREFDPLPEPDMNRPAMVHRSFFFGPTEAAAVRSHLPPALRRIASTFDVLMGFLWRCRTAALAPPDKEEMRLLFTTSLALVHAYLVSDVSKAGFDGIDVGWGKPVYGGPMRCSLDTTPVICSFLTPAKNTIGEKGIILPLCLPAPAMDKFVEEMSYLLRPSDHVTAQPNNISPVIKAAL
ncbi:hypothetical protein QYE76_071214 [Lolium multiflorum]|uniref:Benzyl alcohol O-benzoyltransferase n=1 Tax=Lolium multiflorum TaxID=4521 RepID=A0AAD8SKR3_LOLMU|nr:hypothetical protein QYE76_071214 [Lolium multiflorum]